MVGHRHSGWNSTNTFFFTNILKNLQLEPFGTNICTCRQRVTDRVLQNSVVYYIDVSASGRSVNLTYFRINYVYYWFLVPWNFRASCRWLFKGFDYSLICASIGKIIFFLITDDFATSISLKNYSFLKRGIFENDKYMKYILKIWIKRYERGKGILLEIMFLSCGPSLIKYNE
jgi:hypothetical protein